MKIILLDKYSQCDVCLQPIMKLSNGFWCHTLGGDNEVTRLKGCEGKATPVRMTV